MARPHEVCPRMARPLQRRTLPVLLRQITRGRHPIQMCLGWWRHRLDLVLDIGLPLLLLDQLLNLISTLVNIVSTLLNLHSTLLNIASTLLNLLPKRLLNLLSRLEKLKRSPSS